MYLNKSSDYYLMKILSFDVGIKNLAFCLIDTTENNKIIDWGVINLIEDEDLKCHGFINSNNEVPAVFGI